MSTASEVARAFGLGVPLRDLSTVARGAMGEVLRLDTDRGPFAMKQLFWGPNGNEKENAAFQLAAADAGVPLARPVLAPSGVVITQVGAEWWRCYEWIEAATPQRECCVGTEVAVALARLHTLGYDLGSEIGDWYTAALGSERIDDALDTALRHGYALESSRAAMHAMDAVVAATAEAPVVGCHRDAQDQNVIVAAHGAVLIDWDNAGPAVPGREFAVALENFESEASAMVRAYRGAGGEFAPTDLSVFAMAFSASVHYIAQCCWHFDWEDAPEHLRVFEHPVLEHVQRHPVSLERFERLLEMVPA